MAVQVQLQLPEGTNYCTTYADCAARFPYPMVKWDAFYQVPAPLGGWGGYPGVRPPLCIKNYNPIFNLSLSL